MSESETVIKRIIPYLQRRGYDIEADLKFEEPTELDANRIGFIDILVTCGRRTPYFLIEAKRDGTKITAKHRKQALDYGVSKKCLFVAITNGQTFEVLNTTTKNPIKINNSTSNRIPNKNDLVKIFIPQLKRNPKSDSIEIASDKSLPYKPGLPLSKLNHLIKQCHNSIRKIEKNEENAFSDFSKILFLKLLEEKWDLEGTSPPYSYTFHELASTPKDRADQVQTAIKSMIKTITDQTKYGEVLTDPIKLKKDLTYLSIVKKVSDVSWSDCNLDIKGTSFEYFVRATLKGKKLGQYFTPRPLVELMLHLGRYEQILTNIQGGLDFKVLDPACGTGGFLVYSMNSSIKKIEDRLKKKEIHKTLADKVIKQLKEETFYGIDAHEGVASSAKMNMIVVGDGHNNIKCEDSLKLKKLIPNYIDHNGMPNNNGKAHLILTNPPFGTSEKESLSGDDLQDYDIKSTKGQSLFIQKMISSIEDDSRIVTVIDDGVLNTTTYSTLREHILKKCRIEFIVSLPEETFKPNKINVKSSVLVLKKRSYPDEDLDDEYPIIFIKLDSLGYDGAGNELREFELSRLITEIANIDLSQIIDDKMINGYHWTGFNIDSKNIIDHRTKRFDYKYWDLSTTKKIDSFRTNEGHKKIKDINLIETKRGKSPNASEYVSESEGFALVVKSGSNISKKGTLLTTGDYIEENIFKSYTNANLFLEDGDVLLASTGDGTLGKSCVYRNVDDNGNVKPAIADGHVTIIRVNQNEIYPEYLCDYLRRGFGAEQIHKLYTGSTGLIEITPDDVDDIIVPPLRNIEKQKQKSIDLREMEEKTEEIIHNVLNDLKTKEDEFYQSTIS